MAKDTKKTTDSKNDSTVSSNARSLVGVVQKISGAKTISVKVERFIKHPVYQKFYRSSKNYAAHDEAGESQIGDRVEITESRPLSKTKRFRVTNIISKAAAAE